MIAYAYEQSIKSNLKYKTNNNLVKMYNYAAIKFDI